jgi:hypothetical protein
VWRGVEECVGRDVFRRESRRRGRVSEWCVRETWGRGEVCHVFVLFVSILREVTAVSVCGPGDVC